MLDFTNKGKKKPVFRVDSGMKEKPPFMRSREKHLLLLTVVGLVLIIIWIIPGPNETEKTNPGDETGEHALEQVTLGPMAYPELEFPRPAPSEAEMAEAQEQVDWFIENPRSLLLKGFGPETMAWIRAQLTKDADTPPIPRRLPGEAAVGEQVRQGIPAVVNGRLLKMTPNPIPGLEDMQRLLVEVGKDLYIEVLASGQAAELPLGEQVNIVARYIGVDKVPAQDPEAEAVQIRVFAGIRGQKSEADGPAVTGLLRLGEVDPDLGQTVWRQDESAFEGINDVKPGFEIRPFYYLLGLVKQDNYHQGLYDDAPSAVDMHESLYFEPDNHRGDVFTVDGYVLDAWEDFVVSRDKPFGVNRVIRIWLYNYVARTETNPDTGETRTANGLGLFELSAIVDSRKPLPRRGDRVTAGGRFMKMRGYPVPPDYFSNRNMAQPRFTNVTYFTSLITDGFVAEPPPEPISILLLKVAFTGIFVSMIVIMVVLAGSEKKRENTYKKPMRKLREGRRRLALADRVKQGVEEEKAKEAAANSEEDQSAESDHTASEEDTSPEGDEETGADKIDKPT